MPTVADRARSAAEPGRSAEELAELGRDSSPAVRREVAAHPATAPDTLIALATDRDWRTRGAVAARHDAPVDAYLALVGDRAWQVLFTLSQNPAVGVDVWRAIVASEAVDGRIILAQQQFLPVEIALALAADVSTEVRRNLASRTPHVEVREVLRSDPHRAVRDDARSYASTAVASISLTGKRRPPDPYELAHWPATPRKPTNRWFRLYAQYHPGSDEIPDHVARLWKLARRVDRDPAWAAWWAPSPYRLLDVFGAGGPPGNRPGPASDTLYVGHPRCMDDELKRRIKAMSEDDADRFVYELARRQLVEALDDVARDLGLAPPPRLPD